MPRFLALLLAAFLFLPEAVLALNFKGHVASYDVRAGTITVTQGSVFNTFRFRPDVEVTLNGQPAKLSQIPVGASVTITTSEPQLASKIIASAAVAAHPPAAPNPPPAKAAEPPSAQSEPAASVAPTPPAAVLDPKVEQLSRAYAHLQNAELSANGRNTRPLDELQTTARTSTVDALKKDCLASLDRVVATLDSTPAKRRGAVFAYVKSAMLRVKENGGESYFKSHLDWVKDHPAKALDEIKSCAERTKVALEKF